MDQPPAPRRGRALRTALVAVSVLALLVVVALRDAAAALAVAGLIGVVAGFLALVRPGGAGARGRRGAVAVLAVGGAGMFLGGTAFGAGGSVGAVATDAVAVAPRTASPSPRPLTVLAALDELPVKGSAPLTGYARTADFGTAWLDVDHNGCDTRDDVLRRDLVDRTEGSCRVRAGILHDPYTGKTIHFVRGVRTSTAVQIDHVVPLADAWRTGAQQLTQARRIALANDPLNLFAVDGPTNESKGDGDAATWLPKRKSFRCTYVAHQVAVKRAYGLWVTKAEKAAIARVLTACPDRLLPAGH